MRAVVRRELESLGRALRGVDRQTATVLTLAAAFAVLHGIWGTRKFFRKEAAEVLGLPASGLWPEVYSDVAQFLLGFVIPVVVLRLAFRQRADQMGLGLGDARMALALAVLYAPAVAVACWLLSSTDSFLDKYPGFDGAKDAWTVFLGYQLSMLVYWIGWEYLWRGFVLFGTRHTLGVYAIFVQMIPFAVLHIRKPPAEALLSIPGALILAVIVWRCRSFWIAVPIHAFQMLMIDLWCTLRHRTGVEGIGPESLWRMLRISAGGE